MGQLVGPCRYFTGTSKLALTRGTRCVMRDDALASCSHGGFCAGLVDAASYGTADVMAYNFPQLAWLLAARYLV